MSKFTVKDRASGTDALGNPLDNLTTLCAGETMAERVADLAARLRRLQGENDCLREDVEELSQAIFEHTSRANGLRSLALTVDTRGEK